mmetsp:Transcript_100812/g.280826  ORF Transcript_100812/g.280826 Transcript_100812/m.280826 type:complete len:217 (-) Transcript_100812:279-929(-)
MRSCRKSCMSLFLDCSREGPSSSSSANRANAESDRLVLPRCDGVSIGTARWLVSWGWEGSCACNRVTSARRWRASLSRLRSRSSNSLVLMLTSSAQRVSWSSWPNTVLTGSTGSGSSMSSSYSEANALSPCAPLRPQRFLKFEYLLSLSASGPVCSPPSAPVSGPGLSISKKLSSPFMISDSQSIKAFWTSSTVAVYPLTRSSNARSPVFTRFLPA